MVEEAVAEAEAAPAGPRPRLPRDAACAPPKRPPRRRARRAACKKPQSTAGSLLELVMIVAVALGLALGIQKFLIKPYRIPSESMVPTLQIGQRVLVNRIGHSFSKPAVGDVVVFHPPAGRRRRHAAACRTRARQVCPEAVAAQGRRQLHQARRRRARATASRSSTAASSSTASRRRSRSSAPCDAGGGCDFPRRDHDSRRAVLHDGRQPWSVRRQPVLGPVPDKWIIGGAFATYWPPGRIGLL